jgi:hypothetical protein
MTWILFVWFYGGITSQEFNTHKACVDAALGIRQSLVAAGVKSEFICVEKGKVKK